MANNRLEKDRSETLIWRQILQSFFVGGGNLDVIFSSSGADDAREIPTGRTEGKEATNIADLEHKVAELNAVVLQQRQLIEQQQKTIIALRDTISEKEKNLALLKKKQDLEKTVMLGTFTQTQVKTNCVPFSRFLSLRFLFQGPMTLIIPIDITRLETVHFCLLRFGSRRRTICLFYNFVLRKFGFRSWLCRCENRRTNRLRDECLVFSSGGVFFLGDVV